MTTTPEKITYTAAATTIGGRRGGHATSSDGNLDLELNAPKDLGGPGTGTNPEQLFAAGYSACFNSAFLGVAKQAGVKADDAHVTANVGFGPAGQGYALKVDLEVSVAGLELAQVQELAETAHQVCPYSNAIRGNVPTTVTAVEAA
jgi:Ohr subfamily peroxiredoxin